MVAWEEKYGPGTAYQLIEPIDGFHPNQVYQWLLIIWAGEGVVINCRVKGLKIANFIKTLDHTPKGFL